MFFREHGSGGDIDQPISIGIMPSIDISVGGRVGVPFRSPGLPTALNVLVGGMVIVSELTREETAEAY